MNSARLLMSLFCVTGLSVPVFAQSSDSATVDVTATIVAAPAELTVSGAAELDFGTVTLPGAGAVSCTYSVFPDGGTFISADGERSACSFQDTAQLAGAFDIACAADQPLSLSVSFESTITEFNPGITFETTQFDTALDGQSYDGTNACSADGNSTLTVGGALQVTDQAQQTFEPVRVGTVTLEASY